MIIGEGAVQDPYCHWPDVSETEEAGAVLVRPDGYVGLVAKAGDWAAVAAYLDGLAAAP